MKVLFLVLLMFPLLGFNAQSQRVLDNLTKVKNSIEVNDTFYVYLGSDFDFSASANDRRKEASSGTNDLGVKFKHKYWHGGAQFTVYSKNENISTLDSTENKLFGSNLLLPQNSSGSLSNFHFSVGLRSFYDYDDANPEEINFLSARKFGFNLDYRLNNSSWSKDTLELSVFINSFSFDITYEILNLQLINDNKDMVNLTAHFGFVSRRIGGDYGLDKNAPLRMNFLETTSLGFNGFQYGARLEIGKFYAQTNVTSFVRKDDIEGFSGNQATISFGVNADINLAAKSIRSRHQLSQLSKKKEK